MNSAEYLGAGVVENNLLLILGARGRVRSGIDLARRDLPNTERDDLARASISKDNFVHNVLGIFKWGTTAKNPRNPLPSLWALINSLRSKEPFLK